MDSKTCGNCRWWLHRPEMRTRYQNNGTCHVKAPRPEWPIVAEMDFCGEHQPKEPTDATK